MLTFFFFQLEHKLKLQYFGYLMQRTDSLEKTLMLGRLNTGGEGDNRGWDGWMASPTQWTWAWASSWRWWTGKPGVLQSIGSQRVRHDWATEQQQQQQQYFGHLNDQMYISYKSLYHFCYPEAPVSSTDHHCPWSCGDSRIKVQIKLRRVLEYKNGKTRPLLSFPPPCCNLMDFRSFWAV